ncbi:diguanylate cyclase with PAS/PAC and GAF sensors [Gloeothece citriformis PCC 7424]|uniref:Diguanylate cyclase with PAS/PAC and GAF sensors n=1 Tax=Gloeothece citriformis (strain PCC 7424) TaxID=65393 RepID=B7KGI8_GLOC7|nr:PAS domain S-box protein [Gloeothece citriformis]ACK71915.1 diguanylate cyclase with PAS/PAC and GAF sensors [Gloeothece citriformis PCC 7424]
MNHSQRLSLSILKMTAICLIVAAIGIYSLYQSSFKQHKQWLVETTQNQARLIEAIAENSDNPQIALETVLDQSEKFPGLIHPFDLILIQRENQQIFFLRFDEENNKIDFQSVPWQRKLSGESETFIEDYLGVKVLAAYEPIEPYNWGIIAQIPLNQIRAPFLMAGLYTLLAALIVNSLSGILGLRLGSSRGEQIEENEALNEANEQLRREINQRERFETALRREIDLLARIMETSPVGIMMVNSQGEIILASEQAEQVLGLSLTQTEQPYNILEWRISDEEGNSLPPEDSPFQGVIRTEQSISRVRYWIELPNEQNILVSISASPLLNTENQIQGVVLTLEDITERVQVESALIHSEAQFRAIFEQAAVGIGIVSLSGQYIRVNQRYCELVGYSQKELLLKTYQEITHPDDLSKNLELVSHLLLGEIQTGSIEKRYICKNGQIQWVNLTASTVSDAQNNPEYLIGIVEDISERKRAEEALRDSEERFRSIFKQAAVGIVQVSLSGKFILVNDKFVDLVQYSVAELQEKTFQEITHSDDLPQELNYIQQMLRGEIDDFSLEKRYICKDGSLVWGHLSGSLVRNTEGEPMYFIGIIEDIRERKQAIEDLRQSEEQYRRIIETTAEGVWIIDQENKTTFVNHRMAQMLGYTIDEMKGKSMLDFVDAQEQEMVANHIERRRQGVMEYRDFKFIRSDGNYLWAMIATNPIYDSVGHYVGALGMLTDITERKQTEETLQQVNEQLTARVSELEQRHQDILLLNQVNDFLQACLNIKEAYQVIGELLQPLFPGCSGGLYMLNSSKTVVEEVATWGEHLSSKNLFTFDECWALRRGYIHWVKPSQRSLFCTHTHVTPDLVETLCVPMMAQGQAVGLFYLSASEPDKLSEVKQQLARAVSEHISLALVNLQLRESLKAQSIKDSLTDLYNRRYMEESLKREISLAQRKQHSVGLIMIDVDHFKEFNDTFGHKAGDLVLQEVSNFLMINVRSGDIACRYGGEEFLLILPEASLTDSQQRAEQIRQGIKQLDFKRYDQSFRSVTVSVGVASFPDHGTNNDQLIQAADTALYQAKKQGRDRVVVFSPFMEM